MSKSKCSYCGNNLTPEEIEFPEPDAGSICCECYHEHFEFTCTFCENCEHIDHQHDFLVVWEEVGDVQPGIYRILKGPYWGSNYFDGWLYPEALELVQGLPSDIQPDDWYPCGHLCLKCRESIFDPISLGC